MINIGGYDFEFTLMKKEPRFGYEPVYNEYLMISKKIRHDVIGQRFVGEINYAALTDTEIGYLYSVITAQKTAGYVAAEITMPSADFLGNVFLTIDKSQSRFCLKTDGTAIWTDWTIKLEGIDLV